MPLWQKQVVVYVAFNSLYRFNDVLSLYTQNTLQMILYILKYVISVECTCWQFSKETEGQNARVDEDQTYCTTRQFWEALTKTKGEMSFMFGIQDTQDIRIEVLGQRKRKSSSK